VTNPSEDEFVAFQVAIYQFLGGTLFLVTCVWVSASERKREIETERGKGGGWVEDEGERMRE